MTRSRLTAVNAGRRQLTVRPGDSLTLRLPALRAALEQQLRFRREQLASLEAGGHASGSRAGRSDRRDEEAVYGLPEVDALVTDGARRVLAEIELALVRMRTGRYGICRSCSSPIPLVVLQTIPATTLCLACQQHGDSGDDPTVTSSSRGHRADAPTGQHGRNRQPRKRHHA
jgi:RNA polymerase-binding transcription factor DksA